MECKKTAPEPEESLENAKAALELLNSETAQVVTTSNIHELVESVNKEAEVLQIDGPCLEADGGLTPCNTITNSDASDAADPGPAGGAYGASYGTAPGR